MTLPFTKCGAFRRFVYYRGVAILYGDIIGRRVERFQNSKCLDRVGDNMAVKQNAYAMMRWFQTWWARIFSYIFLWGCDDHF